MSKKLRTLYLESNGFGRTVVTTDTVLRGIFGYQTGDRPPRWLERYPYVANLYDHLANFYERLSYVTDWRDAFCQSRWLDAFVGSMP